jgi:hypothetical protein
MKTSKFLQLNWNDLLKGMAVSVLAFLANWAQQTFIPSLDLSPDVKVMLVTGIAYLVKNWLTPEKEINKI